MVSVNAKYSNVTYVFSEIENKEIICILIFFYINKFFGVFFIINLLHDLQVNIWKQCSKPTAMYMAILQIMGDNFNYFCNMIF